MNKKQNITEEMNVQSTWYTEAHNVKTPDELKGFIEHLINDYNHDYGTICHAMAAAALAGAWCVDKSPNGGITGFQAGVIMWQFIKQWNGLAGPAKLVDYEKMLYPQYEENFKTEISKETAQWLREQATEKLKNNKPMDPQVQHHMKKISKGWIPFNFTVKGEDDLEKVTRKTLGELVDE